MRILMVCLGNICRSPLAEGIMQAKINERGLDWEVDSAGTGDWHVGQAPDARSRAIARARGIDIDRQQARQFQPADLERFDLILAMDRANYRDILRLAENEAQRLKVHLLSTFADEQSQHDVPDPYWDDDAFGDIYDLLEQACERIIDRLARNHLN